MATSACREMSYKQPKGRRISANTASPASSGKRRSTERANRSPLLTSAVLRCQVPVVDEPYGVSVEVKAAVRTQKNVGGFDLSLLSGRHECVASPAGSLDRVCDKEWLRVVGAIGLWKTKCVGLAAKQASEKQDNNGLRNTFHRE